MTNSTDTKTIYFFDVAQDLRDSGDTTYQTLQAAIDAGYEVDDRGEALAAAEAALDAYIARWEAALIGKAQELGYRAEAGRDAARFREIFGSWGEFDPEDADVHPHTVAWQAVWDAMPAELSEDDEREHDQ